jgi:hypothetical protein
VIAKGGGGGGGYSGGAGGGEQQSFSESDYGFSELRLKPSGEGGTSFIAPDAAYSRYSLTKSRGSNGQIVFGEVNDPPPPVPLPASAALLLAGAGALGGLGAAKRRRLGGAGRGPV